MRFSVLMSIYRGESYRYFEDSLTSIWDNQILKPDQLVLVKDGVLTEDLERVIQRWSQKLGRVMKVVALPKNVGLAGALNVGLEHCANDLVFRMDSDDVSLPLRFIKQVQFMNENQSVSVCSAYVEEFDEKLEHKLATRVLPSNYTAIKKFAKSRNPISHPVVCFRKSEVLGVGGYPQIYPEDYALWSVMLAKGCIFSNIPEVLLKMRTGKAFFKRRGYRFFLGEVKVFKLQHGLKYISTMRYFFNIATRFFLRLAPFFVKSFFYRISRQIKQ